MDALDTLITRWSTETEHPLHPPESVEAIAHAFRAVGSHATKDVMDLYTRLGGMQDMDQEALWRLWSLEEIVEDNTKASPYGILFSDYLISCWGYRLKAVNDDVSEVYLDSFDSTNEPPRLVAGSLAEFFEKYLRDPGSVLY